MKTNRITDFPDSHGLGSPSLSRDGHYLLTIELGPELEKLKLYDFTVKRWSELAAPPGGGIASRTWSPDGKYVYFDTGRGKDPAIYRVRVADHKLELIVGLKGFNRENGLGVPWSGVAPDGSPLILRNVGTQEIYALDWEAP